MGSIRSHLEGSPMKWNPDRGTIVLVSVVAALIAPGIFGRRAGGQDQDRPKVEGTVKAGRLEDRLFERWKREASEYQVVVRTNPETPTALRTEPVLSWTNPERGT